MPNQPHPDRAARRFRMDITEWEDLEHATTAAGTDRSTILRDFARWYMRRPGAKLPARPASEHAESRTP